MSIFPPGPVDTSKLGPIRVDVADDGERFKRAQEVVERHGFEPGTIEWQKALRAATEFEREERNREA